MYDKTNYGILCENISGENIEAELLQIHLCKILVYVFKILF